MPIRNATLKFLKKLWPRKAGVITASTAASEAPGDTKLSSKKRPTAPVPPPHEECPICHDPVGIPNPEGIIESWTKLHCGHKFGTHCIQTWLQESINRDEHTNPSCPICRSTAKHPCGHLISPPAFPPMTIDVNYWQYSRSPSRPLRHHRQQVRRRLTRRPGHPLRPPPPPLRIAQTVGECKTCAENAEFDARMRRIAEQREQRRQQQNTGESAASTSSRPTATAAAAIKSFIPGLKRSANTGVRTRIIHVDDERPLHSRSRHAQHGHGAGVFYAVSPAPGPSSRAMPRRRPTPPPNYSRRLSI
ncbi:hypothetical protein AAE478_004606 [Parahypoxylon ruwenzoriense]